jgi:UDP-N-acetylmuramyl pentapeptide synthase
LNDKISLRINSNIIWKENMWYIWVSLTILDILNFKFYQKSFLSDNQWKEIKLDLTLQAWRFTILEWIEDSILIDSSYNAAPQSMQKTIENTYNFKNQLFTDHKIILAIWDMRELGEFTESEHRRLAWISSQVADYIILVGKNTCKYTTDELNKIWFDNNKIFWFINSEKAWIKIKDLLSESNEKFIILFKWSQNTIFIEESIKQVLKNKSDIEKLPRQSKFWIWEKK